MTVRVIIESLLRNVWDAPVIESCVLFWVKAELVIRSSWKQLVRVSFRINADAVAEKLPML